jgi:hypothetical protein
VVEFHTVPPLSSRPGLCSVCFGLSGFESRSRHESSELPWWLLSCEGAGSERELCREDEEEESLAPPPPLLPGPALLPRGSVLIRKSEKGKGEISIILHSL